MQVQEKKMVRRMLKMIRSKCTFGAWLRMHIYEKEGHYLGDHDWMKFWSNVNSFLKNYKIFIFIIM